LPLGYPLRMKYLSHDQQHRRKIEPPPEKRIVRVLAQVIDETKRLTKGCNIISHGCGRGVLTGGDTGTSDAGVASG
jgi:hypothetical protein